MSSPRLPRRRLGAFTLVELLTVMAIIAILMGILFPAIGAAIETAKKAQAKNDEIQLVSAIKAFYTEYGKYPVAETADTEYKESTLATILLELRAKNTATTSINPRKIVFLEIPDAKNLGVANKERGGMATATAGGTTALPVWLDPWGNSYIVSIDANYSNSVTLGTDQAYTDQGADLTPPDSGKGVSTGVIVNSLGRDVTLGIKGGAKTFKGSDDVISWQ